MDSEYVHGWSIGDQPDIGGIVSDGKEDIKKKKRDKGKQGKKDKK